MMVYKETDVMEALSEIYVDVLGSPVAERTLLRIKQTIKELPVEDMEPVVRCGECRYYTGIHHHCGKWRIISHPEDYCSDGRRKDGDENG